MIPIDESKKLFTIKIEAYQGVNTMIVEEHGDHKITYQEVIGALEAMKYNTLLNQKEAIDEHSKKQSK